MNFKKQIFSFHSGKIMGVFISANNELLISLAFDRTVQIHDMKTFKLLKQFETDTMKCSSLYNDELLVIGIYIIGLFILLIFIYLFIHINCIHL